MPDSKRQTMPSLLVILLLSLCISTTLKKSEHVTKQIYTFYYPQLIEIAEHLKEDSLQRIKRSVLFTENFQKKINNSIGSAVTRLDGYINRASLSENELRASIRKIARSAFLKAVENTANDLHTDLLAIENFYRSRIYIASKTQINCEIQMDVGQLKDTTLLHNLYGLPSGALKIADTATEFVPIVGDIWGFSKMAYDPRVEVMILEPAEKLFRPKIASALTKYRLCLERRYVKNATVRDRLIKNVNLNKILRKN